MNSAAQQGRPSSTLLRAVVYLVFFLSGVAALIYEISWSRQIGLLFGHTAAAAATVLASYFAGLALGYWWGGAWATRWRSALLAYGLLELLAAGWAVLVPLLLGLLHTDALAWLIHHDVPWLQSVARAAICCLLLLPATTALGATLPLMARWLADGGGPPARVAWAYGLNTLGGLFGVLTATIVLLSVLGVTASSYAAAAVSAACGLAAVALSRRESTTAIAPAHGQRVEASSVNVSEDIERFALREEAKHLLAALVGIAGFGTLALEVLYTRLFSLVFHNSTYTFGLVVAVVLCGLALGAWLAGWLAARYDALRCAAWTSLASAGAIAVSTQLFLSQTGLKYFTGGQTFTAYMAACLALVAAVVLPPAVLLGTILPLLWNAAAHRGSSLAGDVGRLTAVNTLAAAAGALAASFLLLPALGLWGSFAAVAALYVAAAFVAVLAFRVGGSHAARPKPQADRLHARLLLPGAVVVLILIVAGWHAASRQRGIGEDQTLVRRWEGTYGWIDVVRRRRSGALSLRENVQYVHGSTASATWERRQGHLPLLLHPQPRRVLFLGLGTGATAGSATFHDGLQSITIAELIPEVVEAARLFEASNAGVLDDPRTDVHVDDARHYLLATDQRFDVIVSDLFVPWESKTGYLYTVDHYRVVRQQLAAGGIFCQWLPLWQLGAEELEMIADGFAQVFPNTTLWWGKVEYDRSIVALVGSEQPLRLDAARLQPRLADVFQAGPADRLLRTPSRLSRMFIGQWPADARRARLNTDEHPRLEFAMPLTYADRRTLKRRPLQNYYEQRLSRLPPAGVVLAPIDGESSSADARRWWQRVQLRK